MDNMKQNGREKNKRITSCDAIHCQIRSRYVHCALFQIFDRQSSASLGKDDSLICLSVNHLCFLVIQ